MKKVLFSTIVLFLAGCSVFKDLRTVKYSSYGGGLFIDVPRGFKFEKIDEAGGSRYYSYRDNSYIYIGRQDYSSNRKNIEHLGDSISKYRFQDNSLLKEINEMLGEKISKLWPDTLILSGIDKKGLYWKEILLSNRELCLGYKYVSKEKKVIFDKALSTFRVGRKRKE